MAANSSFLGRGWSFPPEFNKHTGGVKMLEDEVDIDSSLEILLSTRPGERGMEPDYGCDLTELLFKPVNLTLKTYIIDLIKTAILYYEPRIDVNSIRIDNSEENKGVILIIIDYTVRATNSRMNKVYPFYRDEGTELK